MEFRLAIETRELPFKLGYGDKVLCIGSCFAESMGDKLARYGFDPAVNPLGVLFNPAAITNVVNQSLKNTGVRGDHLVKRDQGWCHLDYHSSIHGRSESETVLRATEALSDLNSVLKRAKMIVFTLGTSWGYRYLNTGRIVANCHKLPGKEFEKVLSPLEEIYSDLTEMVHTIYRTNPDVNIVFTVSPVRHWKDGAIENSRSKAILIEAAHRICAASSSAHYFPAYELLVDDLRDYRFYDRDMLHPSPIAIDYIWKQFSNSVIDNKSAGAFKLMDKYNKRRSHNPIAPIGDEDRSDFLQEMRQFKHKLEQSYPGIMLQDPQ